MGGAGSWIAFKEIVAHLAEHRVSAIPVVDACHRVLGVVSEADLLLKEEFPEPEENLPLWWTKQARLDRAKAAGRRRLHTGRQAPWEGGRPALPGACRGDDAGGARLAAGIAGARRFPWNAAYKMS